MEVVFFFVVRVISSTRFWRFLENTENVVKYLLVLCILIPTPCNATIKMQERLPGDDLKRFQPTALTREQLSTSALLVC